MPRLELAAGVLSVKVAGMVMKELATEDVSEYFWTERQVVLGNIRNTQRRFKIFKAKRVHQIREYSDITQWNYLSSKMIAADYATKSLSRSNIKHLDLLVSGS